MVVYLYFS